METGHRSMYEDKLRSIIMNEINGAMSQLRINHNIISIEQHGTRIETVVTFMGRNICSSIYYIPNGGKNV